MSWLLNALDAGVANLVGDTPERRRRRQSTQNSANSASSVPATPAAPSAAQPLDESAASAAAAAAAVPPSTDPMAFAELQSLLQVAKDEAAQRESDVKQRKAALPTAEMEATEIVKQLTLQEAAAKDRLASREEELASVRGDLEEAAREREQLAAVLASREEELASVRGDLEEAARERERLAAEWDKELAKHQVSEAETGRAAAESMVKGLEEAVAEARGRIDGKPGSLAAPLSH